MLFLFNLVFLPLKSLYSVEMVIMQFSYFSVKSHRFKNYSYPSERCLFLSLALSSSFLNSSYPKLIYSLFICSLFFRTPASPKFMEFSDTNRLQEVVLLSSGSMLGIRCLATYQLYFGSCFSISIRHYYPILSFYAALRSLKILEQVPTSIFWPDWAYLANLEIKQLMGLNRTNRRGGFMYSSVYFFTLALCYETIASCWAFSFRYPQSLLSIYFLAWAQIYFWEYLVLGFSSVSLLLMMLEKVRGKFKGVWGFCGIKYLRRYRIRLSSLQAFFTFSTFIVVLDKQTLQTQLKLRLDCRGSLFNWYSS